MKVRILASAVVVALAFAEVLVTGCSSDPVVVTEADAGPPLTQQAEVDDSNLIPCEPRVILENVCQQCHTRPPQNGAPFPIQRLNDILKVNLGQVTRLDMIDELETKAMPLKPVTMTDADRATLLAWLRAGSPAVAPTSCTDAGADAATADAAD